MYQRIAFEAPTEEFPDASISKHLSDKMNETHGCVNNTINSNLMETADDDIFQDNVLVTNHENDCLIHNNFEVNVSAMNNANESVTDSKFVNKSTQTDMNMKELQSILDELAAAKECIKKLRFEAAKSVFNEEAFIGDDKKTKFYTGLSTYKILKVIHETIHPFLSNTRQTSLSTFQQLILTLIKLRLNLSFVDLAYRFEISVKTAVHYFRNVVHVLCQVFKNIIHWPDRDILYSTMPTSFQEVFGKIITVIIDCFEIFIEHPSNLCSAATCWSNYKHHVTANILIGITPQGSIFFVSDAWGGRTSDKVLTENCSFLDNLLPGDTVLADRGFLIHDSVETLHASSLMHAFTKGKSQLHPIELEESRNVAHVRIHVERVIGCLRQIFLILSKKLPITMLIPDQDGSSTLDEIVTVCASLFNLLPGLVSLE